MALINSVLVGRAYGEIQTGFIEHDSWAIFPYTMLLVGTLNKFRDSKDIILKF